MATAVNKPAPLGDPSFDDFFVLLGVSAQQYPPSQWVVNSPALSSLIGNGSENEPDIPKRYWIISPPSSQNLREMTNAEKAVVDASGSGLSALKQQKIIELETASAEYVRSKYSNELMLFFQQLLPTRSGPRLVALNTWFDWAASVLSATGNAERSVLGAPNADAVNAVTVDFAPFDLSDPHTSLADIT